MIAFLLMLSLAVPMAAPAGTPERLSPVALNIYHTADGEGEISPCG